MTRILNAESHGYSPAARHVLDTIGEVCSADLDRAELLDAIGDYEVLVVRLRNTIDTQVFEAASPRLAVVVTATTGLDHIDLEAADQHGVTVLSLRGETEFLRTVPATAEHTWALLLALVRNLPAAATAVRSGTWNRDDFKGRELSAKRLGIVGMGRIGSMVARYGQAFGMHVAAHDPYAESWVAGVEASPTLVELAERSDVLTIHVPLDDATRHLVDRGVLEALPLGAVVVNTSRGAILDESAAAELLEAGHIAGIAVDVVEAEHHDGRSDLVALAARRNNVLVTPHIAGATHESMERTEVFMAHKLARFLAAGPSTGNPGES